MAKVPARVRSKLPTSAFADQERRKFLITDETHARLAWQMLDRTTWPSPDARSRAKGRILAALKRFGVDTSSYQKNSMGLPDPTCMSMDEMSTLHGILENDFPEVCDCADEETSEYSQGSAELAQKRMGRMDGHQQHQIPAAGGNHDADDEEEDYSHDLGSFIEDDLLRVPVARIGIWRHPAYGVVSFTQKDFEEIQENFAQDELGFPPFMRYGHDNGQMGVNDDEPSRGEIVALAQEGPVLFSYVKPHDQNATKDVQERRMRFASAEVYRNAESKKDGRPIGTLLKAIALTNAPFVPNLPENQVLSNDGGTSEFTLSLGKTLGVGDMVCWGPVGAEGCGQIEEILVPDFGPQANQPMAHIRSYSADGEIMETYVDMPLASLRAYEQPEIAFDKNTTHALSLMQRAFHSMKNAFEKFATVLAPEKSADAAPEDRWANDQELLDIQQRLSNGTASVEDLLTIRALVPEDGSNLADTLREKVETYDTQNLSQGEQTLTVPAEVREAATRSLSMLREQGGGSALLTSTARRLVNDLAPESFVRKVARFSTLLASDTVNSSGRDHTPAMLLLGGGATLEWATSVVEQLDKQEHRMSQDASEQRTDVDLTQSQTQDEKEKDMSEQTQTNAQIEELSQKLAALEALSGKVDSLEQQLSNTTSTLSQTQTELAETRQQLAETLSENANLKASLDVTSQKAELFSQNLAQQKREALMAQAVREGIPTAMVEQVFSMAAKFGGNEIKLSNGQNGTADDWAMETLRSLPMESRVQFGQVGHKLSMDAGSNAQTIYGDFMPSQKQAQ